MQPYHLADAVEQRLDGAHAHPRGQQPIKGGGRAAALHVAQHDLVDVKSLVGVVIGDVLLQGAQAGLPAFGHDDDVADVVALDDASGNVAGARRLFGDQHHLRAGDDAAGEREVAAVPAHHLHQKGAPVRGRGVLDAPNGIGDHV